MTAQRDWHSEPDLSDQTIEGGRPKPLHDKAGPLRLTIATLGGLIILGMVLYGLNREHPQNEINASRPGPRATASAPQQQGSAQNEATKGGGQPSTTGAAPQDAKKQQPNPQGSAPK